MQLPITPTAIATPLAALSELALFKFASKGVAQAWPGVESSYIKPFNVDITPFGKVPTETTPDSQARRFSKGVLKSFHPVLDNAVANATEKFADSPRMFLEELGFTSAIEAGDVVNAAKRRRAIPAYPAIAIMKMVIEIGPKDEEQERDFKHFEFLVRMWESERIVDGVLITAGISIVLGAAYYFGLFDFLDLFFPE